MKLFDNNVKDNIQYKDLFDIIWKKAWLVSIDMDLDSDLNSLGTGDR